MEDRPSCGRETELWKRGGEQRSERGVREGRDGPLLSSGGKRRPSTRTRNWPSSDTTLQKTCSRIWASASRDACGRTCRRAEEASELSGGGGGTKEGGAQAVQVERGREGCLGCGEGGGPAVEQVENAPSRPRRRWRRARRRSRRVGRPPQGDRRRGDRRRLR